jgi:hypothetical protein
MSEIHVNGAAEPAGPVLISSAPTNGSRIDINKLRLSQTFDKTKTKQDFSVIPVRKPDKFTFVRVMANPDFHYPTQLLEVDRKTFLLAPHLWGELQNLAKPKIMFPALTRQGVLFLWPVRLVGADGMLDSWTESAMHAAKMAMTQWVRVVANMQRGAYDTCVPMATFADPVWPDLTLQQMIDMAFEHYYIDDHDHPVLKAINGDD